MEPAKIDWKNLDSKFVEDPLYEHINAPKWVDFLAPLDDADDDAWFCRSDCRHPKTVEDFLKSRSSSKVLRSSDVFENIPLGEKKQHRDANLKRRGLTQPSGSSKIDPRFSEDCENQNPNLETPYHHIAKSMKAFINSSTEKKKPTDNSSPVEESRGLKSTLSARNLFAGKDILNQINEFCNELKRFASRTREKEKVEEKLDLNQSPVTPKREVLGKLGGRGKERTPLLEQGSVKEKRIRNKMLDDGENIPISLDLENLKRKGGDGLLPIRTCPPSPQCFSATRSPIKAPLPNTSRSKPMQERGILEQVEPSAIRKKKEEVAASREKGSTVEGRALDVFWFFKPCTLSS